jgi:hypothetical protein
MSPVPVLHDATSAALFIHGITAHRVVPPAKDATLPATDLLSTTKALLTRSGDAISASPLVR